MMTGLKSNSIKIFINYASGDLGKVKLVFDFLKSQKINVWFDKESLLPGQEWKLEIESAINKADIIVVCLSSKSVSKEGFVQKEIKLILDRADEKPDRTIFLVPFRLDECTIPGRLSRWQWIDY